MRMKTTEKLADALRKSGAPDSMIQAALVGRYDDYKSVSATPITDLVKDCYRYGLKDIAYDAINGKYDGTAEESEEWYRSEGHRLLP